MKTIKTISKNNKIYLIIPGDIKLQQKEYDLDRLGPCLTLTPVDNDAWTFLDQWELVKGYIKADGTVISLTKDQVRKKYADIDENMLSNKEIIGISSKSKTDVSEFERVNASISFLKLV